jgi:hypothetical protein
VKRFVPALLLIATVTGVMAGCSDDDGAAAPTTTGAPTSTTTVVVSSTTTTEPAPTTTLGRPRPLPGGTLEVLIVGDSVMHDASAAIEAALAGTGVASARPTAAFGLGFSDTAGLSFAGAADDILEGPPVDQVVAMIGSWDHLAVQRDAEAYADEVRAALTTLAGDGRSVLLLGEPPSDPDKGEEPTRTELNDVLSMVAAEVPRVRFLETDTIIGDADGNYLMTGPDGLLRKPDGRHLCPAGATRFGSAVVTALQQTWQLPDADPAWALGDWRQDVRYDDPPGACDEG